MGATIVTPFKGKGRQIPTGFDPSLGNLVVQQGIYEASTSKKHPLGSRLRIGSRVFYYALAGDALVAGLICESAAFKGSASVNQMNLTVPTVTDGSNAAGQPFASITLATDTPVANQFAEGYLSVYDGTAAQGVGQTYRIRSNTAAAAPCVFELYDDLVVALSTSAKVSICANEYYKVKTAAVVGSAVGFPVGVPLIACASGSYCWLQSWGPVTTLADVTRVLGTALVQSANVAGAAETQLAGSNSLQYNAVGYPMQAVVDTYSGLVFLQISM